MNTRGFTLIEVLVALAIVVVGIGALLSTLSSAAETTAYLRDKSFAEWVGFNQIATTRLALQSPADGTTTGDVENFAGHKWHWQQEITDLQLPGLRRIDVKVVMVPDGGDPPKDSWNATVSSILGAAIATPNGLLPDWDDGAFPGRPGTATNGNATTSSSSGAVTPSTTNTLTTPTTTTPTTTTPTTTGNTTATGSP